MKSSHQRRLPRARLLFASLALIFGLSACMAERERLLEEAKSAESAETRALAIKRLAKDPAENDYALFFQSTQDPSAMVRETAIAILYLDDGPRIPDLLGSLLDDPSPEVQTYAIKGLLHEATPKKLAYLRNAYARKGSLLRQLIAAHVDANLLADFVRHEAELIWKETADKLTLPAPAIQAEAALLLGQSGRQEAVERLTKLLRDPSIYVAAGAASGLGVAGDARAVSALIELLKEPYAEVREPAIEALVKLKSAEAIEPLREIAGKAEAASDAALMGLAALSNRHDAAKEALCALVGQVSPAAARTLAEALRDAALACDEAVLAARLDKGGEDALAILTLLEALPRPSLADRIASLLDAEDARLRDAAMLALSRLPNHPALASRLPALVEAALMAMDEARTDWIPKSRATEDWPEDAFPEARGHSHDHGHGQDSHESEAPALDRTAIMKANPSITEAQIDAMLQAQESERQKGAKKKASFDEFLGRLDRLAKERAGALGLTHPPARVFAYDDDYVPDLTEAEMAHLAALLTSVARQNPALIPDKVLEGLWRSPTFRVQACEIAGAREETTPSAADTEPRLVKGMELAESDEGAAPSVTPVHRELSLVERCLRERDGDAQLSAIEGLKRRGKQAIPLLVEALQMRKEQRAPLMEALVALDAREQALAPIRAIVPEGGADGLAALSALSAFGDRASVPAMVEKLGDPALRERREVFEALGRLGDASVRDALEKELFSDRPEIRAAALRALESLHLSDSVPKIAALKGDYFAEVRQLAAQ